MASVRMTPHGYEIMRSNPADSKKKAKASGPAHPATCDGGVDCMCEGLSENEIRWMRGVAVNGLPVTHARGAVGERLRQSILSRGLAKHVGGPRHELTSKGIAALRAYGRFPERPLQARDFDYLSSAAVRTPHGIVGARQIGVDFSTGAATVVDSQTDTVRQYLAGEWEIVEFDSGGRPSRFLRAEDLPRSNPATRAKRATNPARPRTRKNAIGSAIAGGVAAGAAGAATSHALEKRERAKRSSGIRPNPASTIRPADGSTINAVKLDALIASGFVNLGSLTFVLEDGSRVRANRSAKMTSLLTPSINRITWVPLRQGGKWNRNLRRALKGKAGVYAIREAGSRTVLYVGEGGKRRGAPHLHSKDPDRLFRTILRHFQEGFTPERYALDREQGGIIGGKRARRGDGARRSHDIAYASSVERGRFEEYRAGGTEWTYHKRGDLEIAVYVTPPGQAEYHEGRFILDLEPTGNIAFTGTGDASFDYGDNAA